jgi:outer membrane protein TolC
VKNKILLSLQIMKPSLFVAVGLMMTLGVQCVAAQTTQSDEQSLVETATTSAEDATLVLSRQQCLEIALQSNPTIRVADLEVKRVDYSKKETVAGLFPSIDFSAAYQRAIELQTVKMNMGGQSQSFKMGSDNSWNFGFTASVPIVAPTLWKAIKISDTQILQNLEAARSSRLELANQINQAYYSLLLAIASHKVVLENYEVAKLNADTYEKQFAVGTATEYDVLRSSVQVKNVEPELLQAEIAIKQCKLQLKVLMGMDASVNIEPNVTLKELQSEMYGYVAEVSDRSLTDNSSLRTLDLQKRLAEQNVDLKKMEFLPTIGASFTLNWNALSNGNALKNQEFNPYSNVAVSLSLPIFSGGSRYYGLKGAQLQVKEIELQRDYLLSSLNMQVDLAIDNINKEVRQIESSEESVRQAEKAHQIMQKSFEIGAATYLNLRDSELADTTAKLTYYQAIYNFLVSTSELDMLLGRESELRLAGYVPTSK